MDEIGFCHSVHEKGPRFMDEIEFLSFRPWKGRGYVDGIVILPFRPGGKGWLIVVMTAMYG